MKISKAGFKDGEEIACGIIDGGTLNGATVVLRRVGEECEIYKRVFYYKKVEVVFRGSLEDCVKKTNDMTWTRDEVVK